MSIQACPYPEFYLIGFIEATIKDPQMTPRRKLRAIAAKIREYDEDQKNRKATILPQPTAEKVGQP